MPLIGIDVSRYQTSLNHLAARKAGIRFAMVKATQGHALTSNAYLFEDSYFSRHIEGFYEAGIPVGAYHFFTASNLTEAYKEADFFIKTVSPYKDKISLYLACDAENYNNPYLTGLSRAQLSKLITAFCKRVEAAGFCACHYTNTDHIKNYIDLDGIPYPVWQAHYVNGDSIGKPTDAGSRLAMHQYTDNGQIDGVVGAYDMNFGYAPIARKIIKAKTSIMDVTLDYIEKAPTGANILMCLANQMVDRRLNPIKSTTHEKLCALIKYHCHLSVDELQHLCAYKWAEDLFRKLYFAMVIGGTA